MKHLPDHGTTDGNKLQNVHWLLPCSCTCSLRSTRARRHPVFTEAVSQPDNASFLKKGPTFTNEAQPEKAWTLRGRSHTGLFTLKRWVAARVCGGSLLVKLLWCGTNVDQCSVTVKVMVCWCRAAYPRGPICSFGRVMSECVSRGSSFGVKRGARKCTRHHNHWEQVWALPRRE